MTEFWRDPEFPQLESRRSCQEVSCYRPHTHDRFSVGLIDSGSAVFAGARGATLDLRPGDVLLIPAGNVHECNQQDGLWEYQMIHADQEWIADLLPAGAAGLLHGVKVFRNSALHQRFSQVNEMLFDGAELGILTPALTAIFRDCAALEPVFQTAEDSDAALSARLAPVLERLRHDGAAPALEELMELSGMSKYALIRAVKEVTGLTPMAWRLNERVLEARRMLQDGHSLADAAQTLGFADQSHFHRVFRAHVATTPGRYRG